MYQTGTHHSLGHRLQNRVFNLLYDRSLLYNSCWEDPAVDHQALNLSSDDSVLVITSAGCNALDYALEGPRRVFAVDANYRQTALLELKLAGIRSLEHPDFFALFGQGGHRDAARLYRQHLRAELSPESRQFWDRRISWFTPRRSGRGLYYRGLSGSLAMVVVRLLRACPGIWRALRQLLDTHDLGVQQELYRTHLEPTLNGRMFRTFIDRQTTMSMLGVPYAQKQEVADSHDQGIAGFVRSCIEYICCELPFAHNYFWGVYLRGHYTPNCCPRYLQPEHFAALKAGLADCIVPITATVEQALRQRDDLKPSRAVLLDHMDWMGSYFPQALSSEWDALFEKLQPDARILFRSATHTPTFLHDCHATRDGLSAPLKDHLQFHPQLAQELSKHDRVHTYASFHIADLKPKAAR